MKPTPNVDTEKRYTALRSICVISLAFFLQGMLLWNLIAFDFLAGYRGFAVGLIVVLSNVVLALRNGLRLTRQVTLLSLLLIASSAVWFISTASHSYSEYGMWKAQSFLLFALMPCLIFLINFRNSGASILLFYRFLLVFASLPLLLPLFLGQQLESWSLRWLLFTLGHDLIGMSRSLGIASILAFVFATNVRPRFAILFMALFVILLYGQIVLTERGPILALVIALFMISQSQVRRGLRSRKSRYRTVVLLITFSVMVIGALVYVVGIRAGAGSQELRIEIVREGLRDFLENPMFGIGAGNFTYDSGAFGKRQYPHNIFLEVLAETGITGFLVLGAFFGLAWSGWEKRTDLDPRSQMLIDISAGLFTFAIVASLFSGDLATNSFVWVAQSLLYVTLIDQSVSNASLGANSGVR